VRHLDTRQLNGGATRPRLLSYERMFDATLQQSLFGGSEPEPDERFARLTRLQLDAASWVDAAPGWLAGDETLFDLLAQAVAWEQPVVRMYDREVRTPRLVGRVDIDAHPVVGRMSTLLSDRYGIALDQVSAGFYRNGRDSVAWHGDRIARERPHAVVATVSLGEPRRFMLRPKGGGRSHSWSLGRGDLVVMGGSCQRDWEHTVPKAADAGPRMALMFRHRYD
jgi:alkylated DNA repair dioxygenase AlkB